MRKAIGYRQRRSAIRRQLRVDLSCHHLPSERTIWPLRNGERGGRLRNNSSFACQRGVGCYCLVGDSSVLLFHLNKSPLALVAGRLPSEHPVAASLKRRRRKLAATWLINGLVVDLARPLSPIGRSCVEQLL